MKKILLINSYNSWVNKGFKKKEKKKKLIIGSKMYFTIKYMSHTSLCTIKHQMKKAEKIMLQCMLSFFFFFKYRMF